MLRRCNGGPSLAGRAAMSQISTESEPNLNHHVSIVTLQHAPGRSVVADAGRDVAYASILLICSLCVVSAAAKTGDSGFPLRREEAFPGA
jgi:hypothetical protein